MGVITINGMMSNLVYITVDGDIINVFPHQEISKKIVVPNPLSFIVDNHLGKLAKILRMLGIDTKYDSQYEDKTLALISNRENRILITRDRGLLMRSIINYGYYLKSKLVIEQI